MNSQLHGGSLRTVPGPRTGARLAQALAQAPVTVLHKINPPLPTGRSAPQEHCP